METSFTVNDLNQWAAFSGDYNPIHFDRAAAQALGANNLIVHGMLAMMSIKQCLPKESCSEESGSEERTGRRFVSHLKRPVLIDTSYGLSKKTTKRGEKYTLSPTAQTTPAIVGSYEVCPLPKWHSVQHKHPINTDEIAGKKAQFIQLYGADTPAWICLDAVLFSLFLKHHLLEVLSHLNHSLSKENLFEQQIGALVQTTHTTYLCSSQLNTSCGLNTKYDNPFFYQIDNIVFNENQDMAAGSVAIGLHENGVHVMTLELGLMVKFHHSIR